MANNNFYTFLKIAFKEKKEKKWALLFFISIGSLTAALLEGGSYCLLFLALEALSHNDGFTQGLAIPFLSADFLIDRSFSFFIVMALIFQLTKAICCFFCQAANASLSAQVEFDLQKSIYQRILKMPFSYVNRYTNGELVEFVRNPSHYTRIFFENFNNVILFSCMIIISYVLLLMISLPLALFTLLLFSIAFIFQRFVLKKSHAVSQSLTKGMEKFAAQSVENFQGMRILHLYNIQSKILAKIVNHLNNFSQHAKKQGLWIGLSIFIHEVFSIILVGLSLLVGYFLLSWENKDTLPTLLGFITVTYRLTQKAQVLIQSLTHISRQRGMVDQSINILNTENEVDVKENKESFSTFKRTLSFNNVSFSYPSVKAQTLHSLSFSCEKGEVIAIVGSSGAGKSTLLDLLAGLYQPNHGSIVVDGKELNSYDINSWRKKIGIVSQDLFLFHDSILENIRIGKEGGTREEALLAAQKAGAYSFISTLPQGFDTMLGEEGYRLSQGEKQRISLARALIRDAEILLLDEATSHLDSASESLISETLAQYRGEKTIIAAAHRLSTIAHADSIIVLDHGLLKEKGTHQQLLQQDSIYASLWRTQEKVYTKSNHERIG